MQKFQVAFKSLEKKYQIDSQDEATAKRWAEIQLKAWGKESEFSVKLIVKKAPEKKEAPTGSAIINGKKKS